LVVATHRRRVVVTYPWLEVAICHVTMVDMRQTTAAEMFHEVAAVR
jgi:hypothetical protein